jgi:archaellin
MEIRLNLTPVQKDTRINIEIRPGIGAALPFSKTTPAAITGTSILY